MKAAAFIAFDTETATAQLNSLCQVRFVVVSDGRSFKWNHSWLGLLVMSMSHGILFHAKTPLEA